MFTFKFSFLYSNVLFLLFALHRKTFLEELNTVFPRFALNLFLVCDIVCFILFFLSFILMVTAIVQVWFGVLESAELFVFRCNCFGQV